MTPTDPRQLKNWRKPMLSPQTHGVMAVRKITTQQSKCKSLSRQGQTRSTDYLSQRLTAEEKERVRKIYYDAERGEVNGHYDVYPDPCEVMRVIFGKDFFKEGE